MSNALSSFRYKTINFLQKMGVPLSSKGNNPLNTFLYTDNGGENIKMLQWLLKNRVNPNQTDSSGDTPLKDAISYSNEKAVTLFLKYKANPNIDIKGGNCKTVMPLDYAVDQGNEKIIAILRKAGARTQAQCSK